jgi:uncharacterized protein with HEPN domain
VASASPRVRLLDILDAIDLIDAELAGSTIGAFASERRKIWLIERGLEIISEASRRLPADMKARNPVIPWSKVAAIGNVLRHEYEHVAPDVLWRVVHDDLPVLKAICQRELAQSGLHKNDDD